MSEIDTMDNILNTNKVTNNMMNVPVHLFVSQQCLVQNFLIVREISCYVFSSHPS